MSSQTANKFSGQRQTKSRKNTLGTPKPGTPDSRVLRQIGTELRQHTYCINTLNGKLHTGELNQGGADNPTGGKTQTGQEVRRSEMRGEVSNNIKQ